MNAASPSSPLITIDDFSGDSGLWTYRGVAIRSDGGVILLDNNTNEYSQLWFNRDLGSPFKVEFDASGVGFGDTAIMMFYKNRNFNPSSSNGFQAGSGPAPGYGIEFDYYAYSGDPGSWGTSHVGLLEDHTTNHVAYNMSSATSFPLFLGWVKVVVAINETHVSVDINGTRWLDVNHTFSMSNRAFGFCGGCNWNTMLFKIDNMKITEYGDTPAQPFPYQSLVYLLLVAGAVVIGTRVTLSIIRGKKKSK
nr:hypothetical protein [Candidatus Sigynarchaeota archaeon]